MDTGVSAQKKKNLTGDGKKFREVSTRQKSQGHFVLTDIWNLAKLVKNHHVIIVRQHFVVLKRMVFLEERYAESRYEIL